MSAQTKRVVLVEDDSAIADIYQTLMKKEHLDVEVMSSGQEVIQNMKEVIAEEAEKPDLILLDLILPDMNGLEVLQEIKKHPKTQDILVFILTNQEESVTKFHGVKPDKFIIKANITPTQLLETIQQALGQGA